MQARESFLCGFSPLVVEWPLAFKKPSGQQIIQEQHAKDPLKFRGVGLRGEFPGDCFLNKVHADFGFQASKQKKRLIDSYRLSIQV